MTQEDKELLLKDICGRLPYGVKIHIDFITSIPSHIVGDATLNTITSQTNQTFDFVDFEQDYKNGDVAPIHGFSGGKLLMVDEFKPYLRPISSMTEEEFEKLKEYSGLKYEQLDLASFQNGTYKCLDFYLSEIPSDVVILVFDWLNEHHFDYRGLIEMGLALEAPEGMYN